MQLSMADFQIHYNRRSACVGGKRGWQPLKGEQKSRMPSICLVHIHICMCIFIDILLHACKYTYRQI